MSEIDLVLPDVVFEEGVMKLHLGGTTLQMWHTPGHSPDSIVCMVEEERILFAADTLMPIPFFSDGKWEDFVASLESLLPLSFENVVQGHGEVILRGEVKEKVEEDLRYLNLLHKKVEDLVRRNRGPESLDKIDLEACGKSRIPLNGLVQTLHKSNLETLYWALKSEREAELQAGV